MSQSLSQIYIHCAFHVKTTSVKIRTEDLPHLFVYIAGDVNQTGCSPIKIGGISDHIHLFCTLSKNISIAKLMEQVKKDSSRWLKTLDPYYATFAWQGGYGAFSVSPSLFERTCRYIENQAEHHRRRSFEEEYKFFLKEYGIQYDDKYVFSD